jgi:hypothetical protein
MFFAAWKELNVDAEGAEVAQKTLKIPIEIFINHQQGSISLFLFFSSFFFSASSAQLLRLLRAY